MSLLDIKGLRVHYVTDDGVVRAVNGIDLRLNAGETLGLVGETGAGKTTTALSIIGLIPDPPGKIVEGEIIFEDHDLLKASEKEMRKIRGEKISMIFQDPMTALNPLETVGDQIAESIKEHKDCTKEEAHEEAVRILEKVGIPAARASEYPHQFSGGMKQRVVIAIALACNPILLLADEPTTALDVTIQAQVLEMMSGLQAELGTAMILITHDLGVVSDTCDTVAIIYAGQVVEAGTWRDIYSNPSHPYTVGLFGSIPSLDKNVRRLQPIEGLMPDPTDLPKGCAFHPRCPKCLDKCSLEEPGAVEISEGHFVRCLLFR
jgi:peptide/nickel transport system ATP-binding protein